VEFVGDGPVMHGEQVRAWCSQQILAEMFEVDVRQIRELHRRGLPREPGTHGRYPFPHVIAWWISYKLLLAQGKVVERLPAEVALAENKARIAIDEAELTGKLVIRRHGRR